ncbi:MAG: helix-turn-helix domain-containing protein [Clostridia bacterium]|nr:helix-turn-helix domain-containing protein [Clostridia bacterium]
MVKENKYKAIIGTADAEFNCTIGDVEFSVLFLAYPLDVEESEGNKPKHTHEYYEIVYLDRGNAVFETEKEIINLKSGDLTIESPRCVHKYRNIERCESYKIGFSFTKTHGDEKLFSGFEKLFGRLDFRIFGGQTAIGEQCRMLAESLSKNGSLSRMRACFTEIIMMIYDRFAEKHDVQPAESNRLTSKNVKDIICNSLLYYYATDMSLSEVAAQVFLCEKQVNRICKKLYGRTYNGQKTYLRIEKAKELLLKTDMPVLSICFDCGFGSSGNFYAAFTKAEGVSPLKYRKDNR